MTILIHKLNLAHSFKAGMTCVYGFFGNCRIALSETTNNHVEKQKSFNKNKIHTHEKR